MLKFTMFAILPFTLTLVAILSCLHLNTGKGRHRKSTSMLRQVLFLSRVELPAQRLLSSTSSTWAWIVDGGRVQRVELAS